MGRMPGRRKGKRELIVFWSNWNLREKLLVFLFLGKAWLKIIFLSLSCCRKTLIEAILMCSKVIYDLIHCGKLFNDKLLKLINLLNSQTILKFLYRFSLEIKTIFQLLHFRNMKWIKNNQNFVWSLKLFHFIFIIKCAKYSSSF
jgi:hypothetical protein